MNPDTAPEHQKQVYYRLVSLWAVCEAFAGGIMHGANIPLTGMIISGLAVICIALIAKESIGRLSVLRAALMVSLVKLALSPHSPPTAYIAVLFQGLMGQLLLSSRRYLTAKTILLGFLALVESAIQRILVLLIVFGASFWQAVNQYIKKLTGSGEITDYSSRLAFGYILLHAVAGILIGWYASILVRKASSWKAQHPEWILPADNLTDTHQVIAQKKKFRPMRWLMIFIAVFLLIAWLFPNLHLLPEGEAPQILARSALIICTWWLLVSPLLKKILERTLQKEKQRNPADWRQIMILVPTTQQLFVRCWQQARREYPGQSLRVFIKLMIVNIL